MLSAIHRPASLLGHQGERLKDIGMRARKDIERELGARIFLGLARESF